MGSHVAEAVVNVVVNGEPRAYPAPTTIAAALDRLGLAGRKVAVERNGEIVPRSRHADTALVEGDVVEVVVAVGGG